METCVVVYPAVICEQKPELSFPEKRMEAYFHNRLVTNDKMCIVEDFKGNVHVVARKIVIYRAGA